MMVKRIETIIYKINTIVLFGCFFTLSSRLYGAQQYNSSEVPNANMGNSQQHSANNPPQASVPVVNGGHLRSYQSQVGSSTVPPPSYIYTMAGHQTQCWPGTYPNGQQSFAQASQNSNTPIYVGQQINIYNNNPQVNVPIYTIPYVLPCNNTVLIPINVGYVPGYNLNIPPYNYTHNSTEASQVHIINKQSNNGNMQPVNIPPYTPQNSPKGVPKVNILQGTPQSKPSVAKKVYITQQQPLPSPAPSTAYKPKNPYDVFACTSITTCEALSTVITCLKYWQVCEDTGYLANIFHYLPRPNSYMHIVNAYHHLLEVHLRGKNNGAAYSYIHKKVKEVVCCKFSTCKSYTRNQRERGKEEKQAYQDGRKEYIFLRDLLDTMHAYLVHGYDSGHRYLVKDSDKRPKGGLNDDEKDEFKDDSDDNGCLLDHELKALTAWQANIKKLRRTQDRGDQFQIKINQIKKSSTDNTISLALLEARFGNDPILQPFLTHLLEYEYDTDCVLEQIEDDSTSMLYHLFTLNEKHKINFFNKVKGYIKSKKVDKKNNDQQKGRYGFGVKLYYWIYYKKSDKKYMIWHGSTPYRELYVPPAYLCLKSEMLTKGISIRQWHQKIHEAEIMLYKAVTVKKIRAGNHRYSLCSKYNVRANSKLSICHILSLFFYTSFTKLSTDFKSSFRYLSSTEYLQDLVRRNSKWHFLSKYLREAVELFGEKIGLNDNLDNADQGSFYHGAPYMLFSECKVYHYAPLSTSKHLAVATLFTDNEGLVVALKRCEGGAARLLKFFNMDLISCFAVEDERLFMGGQYPLQIVSIRLLKKLNMNTKPLLHLLGVVDRMLQGDELLGEHVLPSDILLFEKLSSRDSHFPPYVQQSWKIFKHRWRKKIKINMEMMYKSYSLFIPLLFSSDPQLKHVLLLDKIVNIFPNTHEIICAAMDSVGSGVKKEDYSSAIVHSKFIEGIKDCVRKVAQNKGHKVKKITIRTLNRRIGDNCKLYAPQFGVLGWYIGKGRNVIELTQQPYDDCLDKFALLIRRKYPLHEVTSLDLITFNRFISGAKEVPANAQKKWNEFVKDQHKLKINIKTTHKYYALLIPELLSDDPNCKNLLLFDKLMKIFPNAKEIVCTSTDNITGDGQKEDYSPDIISTSFMRGLLERLGKISKRTSLKKIMITTAQHPLGNGCRLLARQFGKLGWQVGSGDHLVVLQKSLYYGFTDIFIDKMSAMRGGIAPKSEITSLDIALFHKLIARENDVPDVAIARWDHFICESQSIEMSIKCLNKHYKGLSSLLLSKSTKNLLSLEKIMQIFPYATEIISTHTDCCIKDGGLAAFSSSIVGHTFISGLYAMLDKDEIRKHPHLKKIIIKTSQSEIRVKHNTYVEPFRKLGWSMRKETTKNEQNIKARIVLKRNRGSSYRRPLQRK